MHGGGWRQVKVTGRWVKGSKRDWKVDGGGWKVGGDRWKWVEVGEQFSISRISAVHSFH